MSGSRSRSRRVTTRRVSADGETASPAQLVVEEPLEIRLDGTSVATTMRTPGDDFELAVGFCLAEGYLEGAEVGSVRYCATGDAAGTPNNIVTVETIGRTVPARPRLGNVTSSCGWCGTDSIDELAERLTPRPAVAGTDVSIETLATIGGRVAADQDLFGLTGASHAAAVFAVATGDVLVVREDIGRHNAVDKSVGRLVLDGVLASTGLGLWVSGRTSYEIVQKAWAAGFDVVVSVSAASSLAVEVAERAQIGLVGFARGADVVRYC